MDMILFLIYTISQYAIGSFIVQRLFERSRLLFDITASFLLGIFVSIPITYGASCVFAFTGYPQRFGMITVILAATVYWYVTRKKKNIDESQSSRLDRGDIAMALGALIFSYWMMGKTLRGGTGGEVFVGSNNVFDFGFLLGMVRSMSWGANIPLSSPFFSGMPLLYHFFFQFWVSLWEYAGFTLVWAVNIPSIISFSGLLLMVYFVPVFLFQKGTRIGWIAVLLTLTNSTLAFWHLVLEKGMRLGDLWRLPTYPFAGPFDGSVISIFTTLNSFTNQRHLAFGIAMSILLFLAVVRRIEKRHPSGIGDGVLGMFTGLLLLWNIALFFLSGFVFGMLYLLKRNWRGCIWFVVGTVLMSTVSLSIYGPYISNLIRTLLQWASLSVQSQVSSPSSWILPIYLWENLGILPFIGAFGFFVIPKSRKILFFSFLALFLLECIAAGINKRGFDQKFYSYLIVWINIITAYAIVWMWERKHIVIKGLAGIILIIISISGMVNLIPIKNEFAFPFIKRDMIPLITFIKNNTPKDAVFVSYSDMIDPVVLSGRKNYFGFYGNVGWYDRSPMVRQLFAGDIKTAQRLGISYLLYPKYAKSDFPYDVDQMYFSEHRMVVYEDDQYAIVSVIRN